MGISHSFGSASVPSSGLCWPTRAMGVAGALLVMGAPKRRCFPATTSDPRAVVVQDMRWAEGWVAPLNVQRMLGTSVTVLHSCCVCP